MPDSQERATRAAGMADTPLGAEDNDRMQGDIIIGPMAVSPSSRGNVGPEPLGGLIDGPRIFDPLFLKRPSKAKE
jgi:hypothetical protein